MKIVYTIAYTKRNGTWPSFFRGSYSTREEAYEALERLSGAPHTPHRIVEDGIVHFGKVMRQKDIDNPIGWG